MTLLPNGTSAERHDPVYHQPHSHLECPTYGALIPSQRLRKFKARLVVIDSDLSLDTLGIEDFQETGSALPKTQLRNTKRLLRLFQKSLLIDEDLLLRRFRFASMLVDGTADLVPSTKQFRLFFALRTERCRYVPLLQIP